MKNFIFFDTKYLDIPTKENRQQTRHEVKIIVTNVTKTFYEIFIIKKNLGHKIYFTLTHHCLF